ncbi:MAG TPA: SDR family NAD(P)-dependent oxidoreductase [Streptosporangiaceae bacterium]|nr:SDR family NAD(P)-dependent oxidoreductase [Streptosporangiaceae bacterium]
MNLCDLTGKTALISGAPRGIGRAIAVAIADMGADLALAARSAEGLLAAGPRSDQERGESNVSRGPGSRLGRRDTP